MGDSGLMGVLRVRVGGQWVDIAGSTDDPPGAIVYLETFAVPHQTATHVPFATEVRDTHGFHAPNSTQLVVPAGCEGLYEVKGSFYWDGFGHTPPTSTIRMSQLKVSGTYVGIGADHCVSTTIGEAWIQNWSTDVPLAAGATLVMEVFQTSGITLGAQKLRLSCRRVARTPSAPI